jgi:predicted LPLAT superfamily acyltransferase
MTFREAKPEVDIPAWKHQAEQSNVLIIRFMVWLSLLLGRKLTRPIVYGIAAFYFVFAPRARLISRSYLRQVLQVEPKVLDVYRHFLSFSSVIHDRIYFLRNRFELFDIRVNGFEPSLEDRRQGIPLLMLGAHLGSFEALRATGQHLGCDTTMMMYRENSNKLNQVLNDIALGPKPRVIALQQFNSMLLAQADIAAGRALGMLADRRLGKDPAYISPFFGVPAVFPKNPFRLASLLKSKVYFMTGLYLGGNRYELQMSLLADFSACDDWDKETRLAYTERAQQAYVSQLEKSCRAAPYNWFNFFDFWDQSLGQRPA